MPQQQVDDTKLNRKDFFSIFIIVLIIQFALDLFPLPDSYNLLQLLIGYAKIFLFGFIAFCVVWRYVFMPISNTNTYKRIVKDTKLFILILILCLALLLILIFQSFGLDLLITQIK